MPPLPQDRSPTDEELTLALAAYIRWSAETADEQAAHDLAFEDITDLARERPEDAWRFLRIAAAAELPVEALAFISAGPLEDLLSRRGPAMIDRVEAEFAHSPGFRTMLSLVWRGGMSGEVWDRVQGLLTRVGMPPPLFAPIEPRKARAAPADVIPAKARQGRRAGTQGRRR